jgi:hypothetical protein
MFNSVQMSRFAIVLGVLVLLLIAVSGMEAGADEGQAISTGSASNVASLQVARVPSSDAEAKEAGDVFGPAQVYAASWQGEYQAGSQSLDLGTSFGQIGGFYATVDESEQNSTRFARVASCYEATVGRYNSEVRGAFANNFSASGKFDAAVTHFYAQAISQQQFGSCSKF